MMRNLTLLHRKSFDISKKNGLPNKLNGGTNISKHKQNCRPPHNQLLAIGVFPRDKDSTNLMKTVLDLSR